MLPALRELLPRGGLARGSVVSVAEFGLLALALVAGASADGAWCGIAGVPEAGVLAAAGLGLEPERTCSSQTRVRARRRSWRRSSTGANVVLRPPAPRRPRSGSAWRRRCGARHGVLIVTGD